MSSGWSFADGALEALEALEALNLLGESYRDIRKKNKIIFWLFSSWNYFLLLLEELPAVCGRINNLQRHHRALTV